MNASSELQPTEDRPARPSGRDWLGDLDRLLVWTGERLNPILVKEARQSLKSRQFVITFGLLLLCGWAWSVLGLALMGPEAAYMGRGPQMFTGYLMILAFPLLVIVPFWAFRSLATEQEDRTYELMSITALSPRQIISGKLGSVVMQMVVYLSAVSPCLAFTYLLRGIAFPTILMLLFYIVLGSLALSVISLLIGTLTSEKHWQVVLSVVVIIGLVIAFLIAWQMCYWALWEGDMPIDTAEFWQVNAAWLTGYATYFMLFFYAAVAQITFASDNRSTRLRIVMLVQYVCFVGWMAWGFIAVEPFVEMLFVFLSIVGVHWYVMGALMSGESPVLSPRVQRGLPKSFLGRAFLTWFNPGPGTGYLFAVCGVLAALVIVIIAAIVGEVTDVRTVALAGRPAGDSTRLLVYGALVVAYVTAYLGTGLLLIRILHRFGRVPMLLGVLIQLLLALAGCAVPAVLQTMTGGDFYGSYSLLHVSNPFWTLIHVCDDPTLPIETGAILLLVSLAALVVFLLNLPWVAREVREVRMAKPRRVAEEDAAQAAPPQPVRTSPWDVN